MGYDNATVRRRTTAVVCAVWFSVALAAVLLARNGLSHEAWAARMLLIVVLAIASELGLRRWCAARTATAAAAAAAKPHIYIDGANLAWRRGGAVSACLLDALAYFRKRGCEVTAVLPRTLCENKRQSRLCDGTLPSVADDDGAGSRFTRTERAGRNGTRRIVFRHAALWAEHERGTLVLVGRQRASDDDVRVLELATRAPCGWICSNDHYRDHQKSRRFAGLPLSVDGGRLAPWLKKRRLSWRYTEGIFAPRPGNAWIALLATQEWGRAT